MEEQSAFIVQGGVSAVAVAFFKEAVLRMIPYAVPSFVLLLLDLLYGIKAAKFRGEAVRPSTAVRRSITKLFSYICWLILASTMALSFHKDWIEWTVLGLVYINEFTSIVGNYLETKGIELSFIGLIRWVIKWGGNKAGQVIDDAEAQEIIKPKDRPRDEKGRFVKRTK